MKLNTKHLAVRDHLQIMFLTLRESKRINQLLLPQKSLENRRFSDDFRVIEAN